MYRHAQDQRPNVIAKALIARHQKVFNPDEGRVFELVDHRGQKHVFEDRAQYNYYKRQLDPADANATNGIVYHKRARGRLRDDIDDGPAPFVNAPAGAAAAAGAPFINIAPVGAAPVPAPGGTGPPPPAPTPPAIWAAAKAAVAKAAGHVFAAFPTPLTPAAASTGPPVAPGATGPPAAFGPLPLPDITPPKSSPPIVAPAKGVGVIAGGAPAAKVAAAAAKAAIEIPTPKKIYKFGDLVYDYDAAHPGAWWVYNGVFYENHVDYNAAKSAAAAAAVSTKVTSMLMGSAAGEPDEPPTVVKLPKGGPLDMDALAAPGPVAATASEASGEPIPAAAKAAMAEAYVASTYTAPFSTPTYASGLAAPTDPVPYIKYTPVVPLSTPADPTHEETVLPGPDPLATTTAAYPTGPTSAASIASPTGPLAAHDPSAKPAFQPFPEPGMMEKLPGHFKNFYNMAKGPAGKMAKGALKLVGTIGAAAIDAGVAGAGHAYKYAVKKYKDGSSAAGPGGSSADDPELDDLHSDEEDAPGGSTSAAGGPIYVQKFNWVGPMPPGEHVDHHFYPGYLPGNVGYGPIVAKDPLHGITIRQFVDPVAHAGPGGTSDYLNHQITTLINGFSVAMNFDAWVSAYYPGAPTGGVVKIPLYDYGGIFAGFRWVPVKEAKKARLY